jgi:hypothetical protein
MWIPHGPENNKWFVLCIGLCYKWSERCIIWIIVKKRTTGQYTSQMKYLIDNNSNYTLLTLLVLGAMQPKGLNMIAKIG